MVDNLSGHSPATKAASAEPDDPQEVSVLDDFLQKAPMSLDFATSTYVQQRISHSLLSAIVEANRSLVAAPEYDTTVEERMRQPSIHSHPSDPNTSWTADAPAISRLPQAPLDFPNFLRLMSPSTSAEDIGFLEHKGALSVPPVSLRNDLLRKYVQYVHPFLPMIDIEETLQQIHNNGPPDQVGLLLFQAMMFAAAAYVDLQLVNEAGYSDKKSHEEGILPKSQTTLLFRL
ncbi:hypothetical protein LTR56_020748 [Elasticomyces elasticus]|nr:hypothetical protein LTR22_025463 [Elasticomyces elasticus]KAK3624851.1 hypothetical protein LTR56_020748 [Elasticomyces elasticus]KAK4909868.1 hypothetical protein LTR49_021408 [Elasticomyces elasticus]